MERIAGTNDIVKIVTEKNETFVGKITEYIYIIEEDNKLDTEIYLSQTPGHTGPDYGYVGLPIDYIKSIHKL